MYINNMTNAPTTYDNNDETSDIVRDRLIIVMHDHMLTFTNTTPNTLLCDDACDIDYVISLMRQIDKIHHALGDCDMYNISHPLPTLHKYIDDDLSALMFDMTLDDVTNANTQTMCNETDSALIDALGAIQLHRFTHVENVETHSP